MKTSVEAVSGTEKRIRVEVPADEVSRRIEEGYVEVRKLAPIRGFRKGKAPMSMVKRAFREHVEADVAEALVKESISDAVKENDLKLLTMPRIDGAKLTEGQEFVFTATVEVLPEITPERYKGIPVTREKAVVGDADVDAALQGLLESHARYHAVEGRGAAPSDLVEFAFSASAGGEEIEKSDSASVVIGDGVPYGKEFEDALAGAAAGDERTVDVEFPADFRNPKYAGKKVAFRVTVGAVREKRLPDLDEEFAGNFDGIAGLEDLKGKVRERLVQESEERSRLRAEEDVRKGLIERNSFGIPAILVDRQIVKMIGETAERLASQGVDLKKVNMDFDKMKERFAPNAERAVRVSLLLDAIAKKENIDVPYSEIEAEMRRIAEGARMDFAKVRDLYGDEERMDRLREGLLGRKVMEFLIANAAVTEEEAGR